MTPEEYRQLIYDNLPHATLGTEAVALADGLGRTLAHDAIAKLDVPPFDNSAMDGFAVRGEDFRGEGPWEFAVVEDVGAGVVGQERSLGDAELREGSLPIAARIMTGAPVPKWADAVVKVEDTDAPRGASAMPRRVRIDARPKPQANVRFAGEDLTAGTRAIEAGTVLGPRALSALASIGYGEVEVRRKPRVAVLSTGAELTAPGKEPGPGMIPDSNSTLLATLVREAGGEPTVVRTVADTAEEFGAALPVDVDLIVTSGGVSMGAFDPVKEYGLAHDWTFEKVTMQPGKPQGHGLAGDIPVIAVPGNPVSVAVSFRLFVRPFLTRLLGQPEDLVDAAPGCAMARAGASWRSSAGRRQFLPGKLMTGAGWQEDGGGAVVVPVHELGSGSHLVAAMHAADVLAVVEADVEAVAEGDAVKIIDF